MCCDMLSPLSGRLKQCWLELSRYLNVCFPTCVVEEGGNEGAVLEEGVAGGDVLKVTLLKQRVLKHHRLHFHVHKPADKDAK